MGLVLAADQEGRLPQGGAYLRDVAARSRVRTLCYFSERGALRCKLSRHCHGGTKGGWDPQLGSGRREGGVESAASFGACGDL